MSQASQRGPRCEGTEPDYDDFAELQAEAERQYDLQQQRQTSETEREEEANYQDQVRVISSEGEDEAQTERGGVLPQFLTGDGRPETHVRYNSFPASLGASACPQMREGRTASIERLPLINENEMQGGENAIVQSPLKLTPILGSPTASPLNSGRRDSASSNDTSCLHIRRHKRKSTMPLPPNTVMYCSYAQNLRKTVSRLIGKEVLFITNPPPPTKKQSLLDEPPPPPVRQFKKLYITQGALATAKQFKGVAKDILDRRYTQQWWTQNQEVLKTTFADQKSPPKRMKTYSQQNQPCQFVLNSGAVSYELRELAQAVGGLTKRYKQFRCLHRQRLKRSVVQDRVESIQTEFQKKLSDLKKQRVEALSFDIRARKACSPRISPSKRATPRQTDIKAKVDEELKVGVVGRGLRTGVEDAAAQLSGYSSSSEADSSEEEEEEQQQQQTPDISDIQRPSKRPLIVRSVAEVDQDYKRVEEEMITKVATASRPKLLHFRFTEKMPESDSESQSPTNKNKSTTISGSQSPPRRPVWRRQASEVHSSSSQRVVVMVPQNQIIQKPLPQQKVPLEREIHPFQAIPKTIPAPPPTQSTLQSRNQVIQPLEIGGIEKTSNYNFPSPATEGFPSKVATPSQDVVMNAQIRGIESVRQVNISQQISRAIRPVKALPMQSIDGGRSTTLYGAVAEYTQQNFNRRSSLVPYHTTNGSRSFGDYDTKIRASLSFPPHTAGDTTPPNQRVSSAKSEKKNNNPSSGSSNESAKTAASGGGSQATIVVAPNLISLAKSSPKVQRGVSRERSGGTGGAGNFGHSLRLNKADSPNKMRQMVHTGVIMDFRKPLLIAPEAPSTPQPTAKRSNSPFVKYMYQNPPRPEDIRASGVMTVNERTAPMFPSFANVASHLASATAFDSRATAMALVVSNILYKRPQEQANYVNAHKGQLRDAKQQQLAYNPSQKRIPSQVQVRLINSQLPTLNSKKMVPASQLNSSALSINSSAVSQPCLHPQQQPRRGYSVAAHTLTPPNKRQKKSLIIVGGASQQFRLKGQAMSRFPHSRAVSTNMNYAQATKPKADSKFHTDRLRSKRP